MSEPTPGPRRAGGPVVDAAVVAAIVLIAAAPYVTRLGFDSDDWAFLQYLSTAHGRSPWALAHALWSHDPVLHQRPVQIAYIALLDWIGGGRAVVFHLVNTIVAAGSAVLLYAIVRRLFSNRTLAFAVAAIYATLPHYSTDRYWMAAHQATLSVFFLLASILIDLRLFSRQRVSSLSWWLAKAGSAVALMLAVLAYEVVLPFLVAAVGVFLIVARAQNVSLRRTTAFIAPNLIALAVTIGYKLATTEQLSVQGAYVDHIRTLVVGSTKTNFGTYGVGYPFVGRWILSHHFSAVVTAVAIVVALLVGWRMHVVQAASERPLPSWHRMILGGVVAYALGYAIFVGNSQSLWFTSTSLGNRTAVAAALGVALVYFGVVVAVSRLLAGSWRRRFVSVSVAAISGMGALVIGTLGDNWARASDAQGRIMATLQTVQPTLPHHAIVILDGVCLDDGTAFTFTGARDFGSRLRLRYNDPTLWGSVIRYAPTIQNDKLTITTYGDQSFRYGANVLIFNDQTKKVRALESAAVARSYFATRRFDPLKCSQTEWGLERGWRGFVTG